MKDGNSTDFFWDKYNRIRRNNNKFNNRRGKYNLYNNRKNNYRYAKNKKRLEILKKLYSVMKF